MGEERAHRVSGKVFFFGGEGVFIEKGKGAEVRNGICERARAMELHIELEVSMSTFVSEEMAIQCAHGTHGSV